MKRSDRERVKWSEKQPEGWGGVEDGKGLIKESGSFTLSEGESE